MDLTITEVELLVALAKKSPVPAPELVGDNFASLLELLKSSGPLENLGFVVRSQEESSKVQLTSAGKKAVESGLPERQVANWILKNGDLPMRELSSVGLDGDEQKAAIGWLKKLGWATIAQGSLKVETSPEPSAIEVALSESQIFADSPAFADLRSRGLVEEIKSKTQILTITPEGLAAAKPFLANAEWRSQFQAQIRQVTPELIRQFEEGKGGDVSFKRFDTSLSVDPRKAGKVHPINQMMAHIRKIFLAMGFQEISGNYVESAFWNMDALFIPQDHPAREMQDTFYLRNPAKLEVDAEDMARVKAIHDTGGDTGSTGWGGKFSEDVSRRALLRTHTTNSTVRYLAENPTGIHKVFGLGKVFRKETMDATHLPEFHQIEGICTEPGANFDMLVGICKVFFAAMGFPEVRFRPAYFPYTEPSMEIDVKYNGKWMELGGCGIFRPEVTKPLGVEHPVLAWGFGLERLAMMRLGLKDIRDLYISDLEWLQNVELQKS